MISHKRPVIIFFFTGIFLCAVFFKAYFEKEKIISGKLYPHVFIDDLNFGGKTKADIVDYYRQKNRWLEKVNFMVEFEGQPIATFSGEKINLHYDGRGLAERAYLIGRSSNTLSAYYQKVATLFLNQSFQISSGIDYDKDTIREITLDFEASFNKPAKNALFKFENNRVVSFRKEEKGWQIETERFLSDLDKQVYQLPRSKNNRQLIRLTKKEIEPEITLAKANSFGIEELIGEGRSDYSHSTPERIHNLLLAGSKFNGVLITKNKVLSFNETVGDISSLTGYKPAYIIKAGKTVLGDGGGVCQVSTTLFRAALNSGLPIVERYPHAYRVGYYENDAKPGFDATVFAPSVDLKIKNDTPSFILIQTEIDQLNNLLYFRFYGKKDNRKIEISAPVLWDVQPPPPALYQDDPTLKRGMTKQVDFAAWGGKANFNYRVVYPNGQAVEKSFFSSYRPWQAVFLVGTAD